MSPFKIKQLAVSIQFAGLVIPSAARNPLFAGQRQSAVVLMLNASC
jgi:hypothetical protein